MANSTGVSIKQIFQDHKGKETDKWSLYLDEWDRVLKPYREKEINLLEIGVQNGGSLEIWGKYFRQAKKIVGCDIDENCRHLRYDDPRISVIIGDINSEEIGYLISQQSENFDIIIDDGSHLSSDIIKSFVHYFTRLNNEGLYIIEDLHASYWPEYEGGLNYPYSAMSYLKSLADILNYEHLRSSNPREHLLSGLFNYYNMDIRDHDLARIHSIEFVNSMCIIKKMPVERNTLGYRLIVGEESSVTESRKEFNRSLITDLVVDQLGDENLDVTDLIIENYQIGNNVEISNAAIRQLKGQINSLKVENKHKQNTIDDLELLVSESKRRIEDIEIEVSRLKTYNLDLEQEAVRRNSYIKELEGEVEKQMSKLLELQDEIMNYATSRIWQISRPIRKLATSKRRK